MHFTARASSLVPLMLGLYTLMIPGIRQVRVGIYQSHIVTLYTSRCYTVYAIKNLSSFLNIQSAYQHHPRTLISIIRSKNYYIAGKRHYIMTPLAFVVISPVPPVSVLITFPLLIAETPAVGVIR